MASSAFSNYSSPATDGGTARKPLRVFFIPFFASSHMIPMVDLACLFAARPGVEPTLVVTPANAALVRPTLDRFAAAGRPVGLLPFPFPSVGLPDGIENIATAPAAETWRVYKAVDLAQPAHDEILRQHRPDAVVADIPYWWTTAIAAELGIPRITFHAVGVFPQLVMNNLFPVRSEIKSQATATVVVPGLPGAPVEIPRAELPGFLRNDDHMSGTWDRMKAAQLGCHGVVVNTLHALEPEYCDEYRRTDARRAWFVGPVALATSAGVERGGGAAAKESGEKCLRWLESREERSVVFVCFGSWCHVTAVQLGELAAGLEASGRPFLWVVRKGEGDGEEENKWMPEGWEERVSARGLVVRGWAPQVAILGHRAVGAFLSHCGWNSVLEAVAAGVPMLTWPLVFEQFFNERLVVELAGAGRRVWDGPRSEAEEEKTVVPGEVIAGAVSRFMEVGGEGEKARKRAQELAAAARAAVEEGGSSQRDLDALVDLLLAARAERGKQQAAASIGQ